MAIAANKQRLVLPVDTEALRVVVAVATKTTMIQSYVLTDPVGGLCDAYKVALERCYFFSEFRDDQLNSVEKRRGSWNSIIREHIHGPHAKAAGTFSSHKSHDRSEIRVPWSFSKASEIAALVAQYYVKRESWILKEMMNKTATDVDPD